MPTNVPDLPSFHWAWWIAVYWLISFPVAVLLGRLLHGGSHELPQDEDLPNSHLRRR